MTAPPTRCSTSRPAGRVPALPGTVHDVGIAAHRDGFFPGVKDIKEGDALCWTHPSRPAIPGRVDPVTTRTTSA